MNSNKTKATAFHQHRWRIGSDMWLLHVICVICGRVSLRPKWPMWKETSRER